ncbi:MAG: OB-fold nucleic acid binding domain-containing protein [Natrialbaceae archaeon]|nr:OB-fold nucleic acid binding domain-containing protein [Natrialbaceae archaeon]
MGSCIICGTDVDGAICSVHQEDALFEFEGTQADQLVPGRFYRGTVDGYADFGVFIDVGERVTGLLHRSELDRRLESLEWESGDSVVVQVLDVRDNGNVDLGWSIRKSDREFRGTLVQSADGDTRVAEPDEPEASPSEEQEPDSSLNPSEGESAPSPTGTEDGGTTAALAGGHSDVSTSSQPTTEPDSTETSQEAAASLERSPIETLEDTVGSIVRIEGEVTGVRQTSGPTVFELQDETGTVECAAFEEAGVRAYPDVEVGATIAVTGEVERHYGDLQVETESLSELEGEEAEAIHERLESAIEAEAEPADVDPLAETETVSAVREDIVAAATAIRRAVIESRPIVVRHRSTADGYIAGAAIERATLPLIREHHTLADAEYHNFERRPMEGAVYDLDAATDDVTSMLQARDRHGEDLPLVVVVDAGGTEDSVDGLDLLSVYGAESIVIDDCRADEPVAAATTVSVLPSLGETAVAEVSSTALAAEVALLINETVRDSLVHLPAVSFWEDVPPTYLSLATEAGYDGSELANRREAVALQAFYQSYDDKRELVADILFDGEEDLVDHISTQFREKLEAELETARANLNEQQLEELTVAILDTDAYTHRYDFPPPATLLNALHREEQLDAEGPFVTLALGADSLHLRSSESLDVAALASAIDEEVPDGGVRGIGGRDGHIAFLVGERAAVEEAALDALPSLDRVRRHP